MTVDEWPWYYRKDGKGQKKPDNGLLPILHAAIKFLADKGHCNRGYSRVIFTEAAKWKKDALRMHEDRCRKTEKENMFETKVLKFVMHLKSKNLAKAR